MEALRIEILNPKALKLIQDLQDLELIKISEEPATRLKNYLEKTRRYSDEVPDLDEITAIVNEVRAERYAKR